MKKKTWMFASLVAIFALAMIGCPTDGGNEEEGPGKWTVTFDLDGGTWTGPATKEIDKDATITAAWLPTETPTKAGNLFTKWTVGTADAIGYKVTADVTAKANYEAYDPAADAKITFTDGYSGAVVETRVLTGAKTAAKAVGTLPSPDRNGYTLTKWVEGTDANTAKDPEVVVTAATTFGNDAFVLAVWTPVASGGLPTVTFYDYQGGNVVHTYTFTDEDNESFQDEGVALPAAPKREGNWQWNRWQASDGSVFDATTTVFADMNVYGAWWTTTMTTDGAIEKVWLTNGGFVVYEFDLGGKNINDIATVHVQYKVSEATRYGRNPRTMRMLGPYFFNETPMEITDQGDNNGVYFGDFAIDANGAYYAKWNSSGSNTMLNFNKFHPYILADGPTDNWSNVSGHANFKGPGTSVVPDTWFTWEYPTSGYTWNGAVNSIARNMEDREDIERGENPYDREDGEKTGAALEDGAVQILPNDTNFDIVYFAFGVPKYENAHAAAQGHDATEWEHGITSLIKDVKIIFKDGTTTVAGAIPEFPLYTVTDKGAGEQPSSTAGKKIADLTLVGGETTSQVFSGYGYTVQYNYRGDVADPVVIPVDPSYVAPIWEPATPATEKFVVIGAGSDPEVLTKKNETALANGYQFAYNIAIAFPDGLDIRSYKTYTLSVKLYDGDNVEFTDDGQGDGYGQFQFRAGSDAAGGQIYNLGRSTTINATIPSAVLEFGPTVDSINVSGGKTDGGREDTFAKYIEVIEFSFSP